MSLPVLDMSVINNYKQHMGPEIIQDLIRAYIDDTLTCIQEVERLYGSNNLEQLGKEAYTMKVAAGNLGTRRVVDASNNLQIACEAHNSEAILDIVARLKNEVSLALGELKALQIG